MKTIKIWVEDAASQIDGDSRPGGIFRRPGPNGSDGKKKSGGDVSSES